MKNFLIFSWTELWHLDLLIGETNKKVDWGKEVDTVIMEEVDKLFSGKKS